MEQLLEVLLLLMLLLLDETLEMFHLPDIDLPVGRCQEHLAPEA